MFQVLEHAEGGLHIWGPQSPVGVPAWPGGPRLSRRVERAILFEIGEWDMNCPSHILPRRDAAALTPAFARLENRIQALEAQVRELGGDPGTFEVPE